MSCAHSFDEICRECFDGIVQQFNQCRADLARLTAERDEERENKRLAVLMRDKQRERAEAAEALVRTLREQLDATPR